VLGQIVTTLVNQEEYEEGIHEVTFNAEGLASGVYFYKLEVHSIGDDEVALTTITKKLLIAK
jgi:hypothetical protein